MIVARVLLAVSAAAGPWGPDGGEIRGLVVNASQGNAPVEGAEVVLRIELDGRLVPLDSTTTDAAGRFVFRRLPVGSYHHHRQGDYRQGDYLPGANRDEIHYPGPRVRLTPERPSARVTLTVHDSIAYPNPLVVRRHEIVIQPRPGALHVTESILVANPTLHSYVGRAAGKDAPPVTMRLSIPPDFQRTTFHKEFFGRRFSSADGKLVTGIPWTPGERELKFTYVLPNADGHRVWRRPLDLPCSNVSVRARTTKPEDVTCNLQRAAVQCEGDVTEIAFRCSDRTLPAGYVLSVGLGRLPVPWIVYGRWLAMAALVLLMAAAGIAMVRRGPQRRRQADAAAPPPPTHRHLKRTRRSHAGRDRRSRRP